MKIVSTGIIAALLATGGTALAEPVEHPISVPGFADFLAVDGDAVWVTNREKVEKWGRDGKLAESPLGRACGTMAVAAGSLWVADCKDKALLRIDLATGERQASVPTGIGSPDGELNVVAGGGSVWVASESAAIARVDPATNAVVATVPVNEGSFTLAYGFDALWAVSLKGETLQKIDPATNQIVATTAMGAAPGFLAAGEGAVWVQEQGDGTLARIDPASAAVTGRVAVDETLKWGDIDTGGGRVWLRTTLGQTFVEVDPAAMAVVGRHGAAAGSGALRWTPEGVWTSAHDNHTLSWWTGLQAPAAAAQP